MVTKPKEQTFANAPTKSQVESTFATTAQGGEYIDNMSVLELPLTRAHNEVAHYPKPQYPKNWLPEAPPELDMMSLKGKDYLQVQDRVLWFIYDQRHLIANGLAKSPFAIEILEKHIDWEKEIAYFHVCIHDVLGNEAHAEGTESKKDFGDYIEKAHTKAIGRALLLMGYSTGRAQELDETDTKSGEPRIVDAPRSRPQASTDAPKAATEEQVTRLKELYPTLPTTAYARLTYDQAQSRITDAENRKESK